MKIIYDPEADAAWIHVQKGVYEISEPATDDVIVDFDKEGHILNIEILNASEHLPEEILKGAEKPKRLGH